VADAEEGIGVMSGEDASVLALLAQEPAITRLERLELLDSLSVRARRIAEEIESGKNTPEAKAFRLWASCQTPR
jgi:hypothetical protein